MKAHGKGVYQRQFKPRRVNVVMPTSERKGAESTNIYISENPDEQMGPNAEPNCFTSSFVEDEMRSNYGGVQEMHGAGGIADKIETAAYGSQVSETLLIKSAAAVEAKKI